MQELKFNPAKIYGNRFQISDIKKSFVKFIMLFPSDVKKQRVMLLHDAFLHTQYTEC